MKKHKIVIDTNVLVSALKSKNGYSFRLISMIDDPRFLVNISVPLILEYEYAVKKEMSKTNLAADDIESILDYICFAGKKSEIYYLWRPFLKDPKDDMVLELAVESGSKIIISFNKIDFKEADKFGIRILTPKEFLKIIGDL